MLQLSEQLSLSAQLQGMLVSPSKFSQPKAAARGLHCKDGGSAPRSKSSSLPAALCASSAAKPPPLPSHASSTSQQPSRRSSSTERPARLARQPFACVAGRPCPVPSRTRSQLEAN